jgi:Ca-activated chloride channel family protein
MQFLNPNVFYIMLIPLVLLIVLILTSNKNYEQYFSKNMIAKLQANTHFLSQTSRNIFLFLTLIFFILALSRPVIDEKEHKIQQELIPIVIALDVSQSMQAQDIFPSRIQLAKEKLKAFIDNFPNATIGLVLFAKDAMVLSPVSEDFTSLRYIVENIDTSHNFTNGSNIYGTLATAQYMFEDFNTKNIIILSDGGNKEDYEKEIEYAKDKSINVYSIGLATSQGAAIPNTSGGYMTNDKGEIVTVQLNEAIKKLALETNGGYIDYTLDNNDVQAIINRINSQSKKETLEKQNVKIYTELFYYPLGLALLCLFIALNSFPRKTRSSLATSFIIATLIQSYTNSSYALELDFEKIKKAKEYYQSKQYDKAAQEYRDIRTTKQSLYNLGNSLYKQEKYKEAIDVYSKVISDEVDLEHKKLHNIGNSYVKLQNLEKAKSFYEKALKVKDDKQTRENLDIVKEALKKQKQNEKEKQQEDKKQKEQNQEQNQDNQDQNKKNNQLELYTVIMDFFSLFAID